jgi:hypothetical protein
MHTLSLIFLLLLSGCAAKSVSSPEFYGPPPFSDWMQHALANPNANPHYHRFHLAWHGERAGLHAYFVKALELKNASTSNCEHEEALRFELTTIIDHVGDAVFANALALETRKVRKAVAFHMHLPTLSAFPMTLKLLAGPPL